MQQNQDNIFHSFDPCVDPENCAIMRGSKHDLLVLCINNVSSSLITVVRTYIVEYKKNGVYNITILGFII
jgi:hypothetical protein